MEKIRNSNDILANLIFGVISFFGLISLVLMQNSIHWKEQKAQKNRHVTSDESQNLGGNNSTQTLPQKKKNYKNIALLGCLQFLLGFAIKDAIFQSFVDNVIKNIFLNAGISFIIVLSVLILGKWLKFQSLASVLLVIFLVISIFYQILVPLCNDFLYFKFFRNFNILKGFVFTLEGLLSYLVFKTLDLKHRCSYFCILRSFLVIGFRLNILISSFNTNFHIYFKIVKVAIIFLLLLIVLFFHKVFRKIK